VALLLLLRLIVLAAVGCCSALALYACCDRTVDGGITGFNRLHCNLSSSILPCAPALQVRSLSEPLEMLPAVTATNLKFDLFDCLQMT
jgi:hypothetical protein